MSTKYWIRGLGSKSGPLRVSSPEKTEEFLDDFNHGRLGVYKGYPIGEVFDVFYNCKMSTGEVKERRINDSSWSVFIVVTAKDEPPAYKEIHLHFGFESESSARKFQTDLTGIYAQRIVNDLDVSSTLSKLLNLYRQDSTEQAGISTSRPIREHLAIVPSSQQ